MIIIFLFIPILSLFGYQSMLESKGINDPTLSISLYKTTLLLDAAAKLFLYHLIDDFEAHALVSLLIWMAFSFTFFVKLSLNIPKKSLRDNKKYPLDTNYTLCAFNFAAWGGASILFNIILLLGGWNFEEPGEVITIAILSIAIIIFYMVLASKALLRIDRLKYPSIRSLSGLANNNSPIILLRSFKIDSNPTMDGKVFDETICENLDLDKNPIISLANPDEILPSGGSLKIQAKDSEWKEVVKETLKNCRAVILVEGLSEGLHWEISKMKEYLNPSQLFIMVPSKEYRELAWCYNNEAGSGLFSIIRNSTRIINQLIYGGKKNNEIILNAVWTDFSTRLNEFGIHTPNIFPGDNTLLYFDENWNCKAQINMGDTRSMLNSIIYQTSEFNNAEFDYKQLGKKIETYEVNGFLSKEEVAPFKALVDQCNRIGKLAILTCLVLFLLFTIF